MNLEQARMVEDCEAREGLLSDWERVFVADIGSRQRDLTEKQAGVLGKIWDRVTDDQCLTHG